MGEVVVDAVVAGATVAGLVVAADLAAAGRDVLVLDATPADAVALSSGAATVAVGALSHRIALHHGEATAVAYLRGLAGAVAELEAIAVGAGIPHAVVPGWGVAVDGHLAFRLRHEARLLRLAGSTVEFSDEQPFDHDVRPMLTVADQGYVDPRGCVDTLADAAREAGAALLRSRIERVTNDGFATSAGRVRAAHVIDTIGVLDARLVPAVRELRQQPRPVLDVRPLCWRAGEPTTGPVATIASWLDTPVEHLVATGAGATLLGRPGGSADELEDWARTYLAAAVTRRGSVVTEETPDGLPVVGAVSALLPFWVARGFGALPLAGSLWGGHALARSILSGERSAARPRRLLGTVAAGLRTRIGVLADPKQGVADVLAARGLSRRVSERAR